MGYTPWSRFRGRYPPNWPEIAARVKWEAGWRCVRCDHPHDPPAGRTLTVHHLDGDRANSAWWNLLPLCQACHLSVQARVILEQPWLFEHSEWFKPYAAGWYAASYEGNPEITRDEAEARMDELLALERLA